MCRKLFLLTFVVFVLGVVSTNVAMGDRIVIPVVAGSDDAEEDIGGSAGGTIDLGSSDLELIHDNDASDPLDEQVVGLRFVDVQIPKGEVIARAYVRFDADKRGQDKHLGEVHLLIDGQLDPNPATFEDTPLNISARPRTAAIVQWDEEEWDVVAKEHAKYWTADISSVIQEIVDQDGWVAGNALVVIISQDPDNPSTGMREAESYNGDGDSTVGRSPTLYVEFGDVPAPDEIHREAESADVMGASWRHYPETGQIGSENGDGDDNNTAPGPEWTASYDFEATGGVYKVVLRAQENGSDSFWVRIIPAISMNHEDPDQPGTGWTRFNGIDTAEVSPDWDDVHSDDHNQDTVYWELAAGPHTIEIAKREDGVLFDSFIITNDLTLAKASLPGVGASALDIRVAASDDDAEQHVWPDSGGSMESLTSSDLEIPYEDSGTPPTEPQHVGMRFTGVLVSPGGTVAGAYVEFEVDETDKNGGLPVNVVIEGELSANAAAFERVDNNITDRPVTAAQVKWSIPAGLAVSDKVRTPDISSIIREIVGQGDWAIGNALVLIVRDDPDNPSEGIRTFESVNGESDNAPLLHMVAIVPLAKDPVPADGAAGVSAVPVISTFVSDDVPMKVPEAYGDDPRGKNSTLTVADSIKINDLNVELDIRMRGNNAELNVYLTSPDGKKVELFTDVGSNQDDFKNTILDDEAGTSIRNGRQPFRGIYKPEKKLSGFDGRNTAGEWKLRIEDDWNTNTGGPFKAPGPTATLNSWRIVVENPILISWSPPGGAASQDVYFTDDVNGIGDAGPVANLPAGTTTLEVVLEMGKTYYWRVDGVSADGSLQSTGDAWSFSTKLGNVEIDRRISNNNDDVEERLRRDRMGDLDMGSSDLEFPYEDFPIGDPQRVGLRFRNVGVPGGSEIIGSYIEFEVDETKGGEAPVNVIFDAQLTGDAESFQDNWFNVSQRTFTETVVPWSVPNWTAVNEKFQSPDISVLVQELVNLDDWTSGNDMVYTIQDDPSNPSEGVRAAESHNGEASAAPLLHIDAISEAGAGASPADGAVDVEQDTILSWTPGLSAVSRDVFFGTANPPAKREQTTGTSLDLGTLDTSTTYYWKVDEIEADGTKHAGPVWSFTTVIGEAYGPMPTDGSDGVPPDMKLSWIAGHGAVSHDVYLGANGALDAMGNQEGTTFDPGALELNTSYSWRVDEINADGDKSTGDVWTFTTLGEGLGQAIDEVWFGIGGNEIPLLTGDPRYPDAPDSVFLVDLLEGPTNAWNSYGSRIRGWLYPPQTGDFTFWIATDDNGEFWLSTDSDPANVVLASTVSGWAGSRNFDDGDVTPSDPIALEVGQAYYFEGLVKEGGGGDNIAVAWDGPGTGGRQVIGGQFLAPYPAPSPYPLMTATNPDPADGATIDGTFAFVSWTAGPTAVSHDGYIGTAPDALEFQGNLTDTTVTIGLPGLPVPDGLVPGTTYYWRIDEVTADPNVVHEGDVWSFTTATVAVTPDNAHNPIPGNGEMFVPTDTQLSWTAGLGAKLHSVYFGDDLDTVTNAVGAPPLPFTTFNPGPLEPEKTYYWRVDEFNPPFNVTGEVWSFTTAGTAAGGLQGEYYDFVFPTSQIGDFTELLLTRIDATVDFDWGNDGPDPLVPSDGFSVRWTGQILAVFTETYYIYAVGDDGVRLWVNGVQLADGWRDQGPTEYGGTIDLVAGEKYDVVLEYYERGGGAVAKLGWESPSTSKGIIPEGALSPPAEPAP